VLGSEVVVLVTLGFLARQDDDLPTLVRESFEHPTSLAMGLWVRRLGSNPSKYLA
jgi:hypothetical protein